MNKGFIISLAVTLFLAFLGIVIVCNVCNPSSSKDKKVVDSSGGGAGQQIPVEAPFLSAESLDIVDCCNPSSTPKKVYTLSMQIKLRNAFPLVAINSAKLPLSYDQQTGIVTASGTSVADCKFYLFLALCMANEKQINGVEGVLDISTIFNFPDEEIEFDVYMTQVRDGPAPVPGQQFYSNLIIKDKKLYRRDGVDGDGVPIDNPIPSTLSTLASYQMTKEETVEQGGSLITSDVVQQETLLSNFINRLKTEKYLQGYNPETDVFTKDLESALTAQIDVLKTENENINCECDNVINLNFKNYIFHNVPSTTETDSDGGGPLPIPIPSASRREGYSNSYMNNWLAENNPDNVKKYSLGPHKNFKKIPRRDNEQPFTFPLPLEYWK